jgi:Spy/CpxP family protein refolding chaperone
MKRLSFLTVALTAVLFLSSQFVKAQTTSAKTEKPAAENKSCCQQDMMMKGIPDLTDQQKKQIEDLQTPHMKDMMQFKNQMAEKHAHLKTLQTADKPDNAAINKTIDEITGLQNDMMKKCSAHRQAVRALLTDKQRVIFDAKCGKGGEGMMGNGCGGGKGHGMKG